MGIQRQRYPINAKFKRCKPLQNISNIQRPIPQFEADTRRFLKFKLNNGYDIKFLLDSGATSNVLTYQDYKKLGKPSLVPTTANLTTANGSRLDSQEVLTLKMLVKGIEKMIDFEVSKMVTKSILGEGTLTSFRIIK